MRALARAGDVGVRTAWLWRNSASFASAEQRPPRLFVDVSTIIRHDAQTGIQRVVRAVWSGLSELSGEHFVAHPIFATPKRGYCYAPVNFLETMPREVGQTPVGMGPGDKFLGLDLTAHILPKYRRQLHAWRESGASAHVVVYDLLPLQNPEWFSQPARKHFLRWIELIRAEADQVLCISDSVAVELRERLGSASSPRVGRLEMGSDLSGSRPSTGMSTEVSETIESVHMRRFILMVGTIEPRKGYEEALAAFDRIWRTDAASSLCLVIVGKSGWKTDELQERIRSHSELGKRLYWLRAVSDEALGQFYATAHGVLVASKAEGFGLPLIEAAAHGCPILARDLPVFREQRLSGVTYFREDNPDSLASQIVQFASRPAGASRVRLNLPTWKTSVDNLVAELGLAGAPGRQTALSVHS